MRGTTPSSRQLNHEFILVFVADERWSLFASKMTPCAGSASQGHLPIETFVIGEGLVFLDMIIARSSVSRLPMAAAAWGQACVMTL